MSQCRIAVTEKCNLKCPYCCMQQKEVLDTFEEIQSIYDIKKIHEYDTIMITGGEPLINFNHLRVLMGNFVNLVSRNTKIYLYTNGIELQYEDYEWTLKKWFNGLNIGLHEPDSWDYKAILTNVNKIIPVRILIYEKLVTAEFIDWCKTNNIQYRAWKMDDCYADEDRFIIKR